MKVLIYGGGAVGLGLSSCLLKAEVQVDVVARPATVDSLRENGLQRTGIFGDFHAEPATFGCFTDLSAHRGAGILPVSDACPPPAYDFVLVCVKSPDSRTAAESLSAHKPLLTDIGRVVLCQNGWGNAEIFAEYFPKDRICSARVITGFTRPTPNEVVITVHADAIHLGSLFAGDITILQPLAHAITQGGIPCQTTPDIEKDLWAKMLYNCALNPLGAVLDVLYGALADHASPRRIMDAVVAEIYAVLAAAEYSTHWPTPAEFLQTFYSHLVPSTAQHKSSTLQDILAGKPTEIDALTGAVIDLARRHRVQVPTNICLYNLVKFIETKAAKTNEQEP